MFEVLIGDPRILHVDALEHPDKYKEETTGLLEEVIQGRKLDSLSAEEQKLLDEAVLDFHQAPAQKKQPGVVVKKEVKTQSASRDDYDSPEAELPAYWWL